MDDDVALIGTFCNLHQVLFHSDAIFVAVFLAVTEMETVQVKHELLYGGGFGPDRVYQHRVVLFGQSPFFRLESRLIRFPPYRCRGAALFEFGKFGAGKSSGAAAGGDATIMDLAVVPLAPPRDDWAGAVGAAVGEKFLTAWRRRCRQSQQIPSPGSHIGTAYFTCPSRSSAMIGRSGISHARKVTGLIL